MKIMWRLSFTISAEMRAKIVVYNGHQFLVTESFFLKIPGGGVLTCKGKWVCAALMGHFFYKKSLSMDPVFFTPKNP